MCRPTIHNHHPRRNPNDIEIKSFIVRLSDCNAPKPLPELLTLLFLPRIKQNALEIDGFMIRPGSPAIVSLHRFVVAQPHQLIYGSRQRVRASQGMRFQVHLSKATLLEGILRKDHNHQCKLECELQVDVGHGSSPQVSDAEVCVAVEGEAAITERVPTVARRKRDKKPFKFNEWELEDIPEERELCYFSDCNCYFSDCNCNNNIDIDDAGTVADPVCCPCSCDSDDLISDYTCPKQDYEDGLDIEGARWAVDLGIWVMCLGLGYLVSKASIKSIGLARRPRMFLTSLSFM